MLTIDCSRTGLNILDAQGAQMPDTAYWPQQHGRQVGALRTELDYFAQSIRSASAPTVTTPLEAANAVAVMEAAEQSARQKQPVTFQPIT